MDGGEEAEYKWHNRDVLDGRDADADAEDYPLHEKDSGEGSAVAGRSEGVEEVSRSLQHATLRLSFPIAGQNVKFL